MDGPRITAPHAGARAKGQHRLPRPYNAMAVEEHGAGVAEPIVSLSEFSPVASILNAVFQGPHVTAAPASRSFVYYPWGGRCGRALSRRLRASAPRGAEVETT
jgi:hypothetical protein